MYTVCSMFAICSFRRGTNTHLQNRRLASGAYGWNEALFWGDLTNVGHQVSVDFIDRAGNKKPGTTRSQIVPRPALTSPAMQATALLVI